MKGEVVDDKVAETEEEPECMHWHQWMAVHETGCKPAELDP